MSSKDFGRPNGANEPPFAAWKIGQKCGALFTPRLFCETCRPATIGPVRVAPR